jgi:hypothetical protein
VAGGIIAYVGKTKEGAYKPFYFGKSLPATEIEISEDMYIITAEEAKKHIEPPKLTSIVISPQDARIELGKKQAYVVTGLDQHNREIAIGDVVLKATGGTIDKNGVFTAGKDEGNFVITATIGGITGSANFTIAKEGEMPPKPRPTAEGINKLSWNGEVPPQKWMNFYTKVLSKFAGGKGLKITINVEVSPEGGVSTQKIEETKVALRELGLNDDLKSE